MFISYAICTHNEGWYIIDLLNKLTKFINEYKGSAQHEIVILDDNSTDPTTQMALKNDSVISKLPMTVATRKHAGDFAEHKNHLTDLCKGDWIMNLDADEWITQGLMELIPEIIDHNSTVDAIWFPRVNTVDGLTQAHVDKWHWNISTLLDFTRTEDMDPKEEYFQFLQNKSYISSSDELSNGKLKVTYRVPVINFPDPQLRLYKKSSKIRWKNAVHEQLFGYGSVTALPMDPRFAIRHFKNIKRQEEQNALYEEIAKRGS